MDAIVSIYKFQFLMVRLKVDMTTGTSRNYNISIPYGAIKRAQREQSMESQSHISIPYGAIKSFS